MRYIYHPQFDCYLVTVISDCSRPCELSLILYVFHATVVCISYFYTVVCINGPQASASCHSWDHAPGHAGAICWPRDWNGSPYQLIGAEGCITLM